MQDENIPNWDDYFVGIAFAVSKRSPDPSTKHGCVIVNSENRIISTGYNGPIAGIDDNKVIWERPEKYKSRHRAHLFCRL